MPKPLVPYTNAKLMQIAISTKHFHLFFLDAGTKVLFYKMVFLQDRFIIGKIRQVKRKISIKSLPINYNSLYLQRIIIKISVTNI